MFDYLHINPGVAVAIKVLLPVVSGLILAKLSKKIIYLIRKFITQKTPTEIDDRIMLVLKDHLGRIFIVAGIYIGLQKLEMEITATEPVRLLMYYLSGILFVAAAIILSLLIMHVISEIISWYIKRLAHEDHAKLSTEFMPLFIRILKIGVAGIMLVVVLEHFGLDISAVVVSLGVGSLAVALAAQETLANIISGFVIMIDRPFRYGDRVLLESGEMGDVYEIGLRSTKIKSFDNTLLIMPNAEIVKGKIVNLSYPEPQIRVVIYIGVAYGSDLQRVKDIMIQICEAHPEVLDDPPPEAYFLEFGDSALNFRLSCRVGSYTVQWRVAEEIRLEVDRRFREEGIEIPFPQRVVYLKKNENDNK